MSGQLDPDTQDALGEIVNIGMGRAAAALAQSLNVFVRMSPATIRVVTSETGWHEVVGTRWRNRDVTVARQGFYGDLNGEALALFDADTASTMNDLLGIKAGATGKEVPLELANLLIGTCVSGMASHLSQRLGFYPSAILFQNREFDGFLQKATLPNMNIILITVDFQVEARAFLSRVVFAFAHQATNRLLALTARFLESLE